MRTGRYGVALPEWGPRLLTAGLLAAAIAGAVAAAHAAPAAPAKKDDSSFQTSIPAAILLDPDSDSVLFEKNGDQPVAPASLAKLMTLEFVFNELKQGHIKLDDEFVISENAWRKGGAPSHGSTMYARHPQPGQSWTTFCTASSSIPQTTPASRSPKGLPATRSRSAPC